ncbi:hypothetical protein [Lysobacter tyrosinilyticus]
MARFPKIDRPCPLDTETQKRIRGSCDLCGKTVHCLDGKSDAERTEFMSKLKEPACVSYRLTAGIGAALALSMAGPVLAADQTGTAMDPPSLMAAQTGTSPLLVPGVPGADAPQTPLPDKEANVLDQLVFVGGVSKPDQVEWVEVDESLPELPMRQEAPLRE